MLTSILVSRSLISDFNSLLTLSIFTFKLLSTVSILVSKSLISDFKVVPTL
ncbi:hypothetical protein btBTE5EL_001606 (plasmid) [Borrelia turicatae]|nr:hypothetical protein btBTE5EL_001606 [Borrelia turicatae]